MCLTIKTASSVFTTLYGLNIDIPAFSEISKTLSNKTILTTVSSVEILILHLILKLMAWITNNWITKRARTEVLDTLQEFCFPRQARLDVFLTSMMDLIHKTHITLRYLSDHSSITLEIIENKFLIGKGFFGNLITI